MKNIDLFPGDYHQIFLDIVRRKEDGPIKTRLQSMSGVIRRRYDEYEANNRIPENITIRRIPKTKKEALKNCYDNSGKFKTDLLKHYVPNDESPAPECPYCQLHKAQVWDHFLPASKHPDFYVYPPNLILVCHNCNEIKGNRYINPIRKTLNPYYDNLYDVRYLCCTIEHRAVLIPRFYINPDIRHPRYDPYVANVAREHFNIYRLGKKYRAEATNLINEFRSQVEFLHESFGAPPSQITLNRFISKKIGDLIARGESINNWQFAFWDSMRAFPGLSNYVNQIVTNP